MANGDAEKLGEEKELDPRAVARSKEVELAADIREDVKKRGAEKRKSLMDRVKDWFKGVWEGFKGFFGGSKKAAEDGLQKAAEKGKEFVDKVIDGALDLPAGLRVSSDIQSSRWHKVLEKYRPHKGIDIAMPEGTPLKWFLGSTATVLKVANEGGAGNMIKVLSGGKTFKFFHLKELPKLAVGTVLKKGDLLGLSGMSGIGTGPHLHFEVWEGDKVLDPLPYLPKSLQGQVLAMREGKTDALWGLA